MLAWIKKADCIEGVEDLDIGGHLRDNISSLAIEHVQDVRTSPF